MGVPADLDHEHSAGFAAAGVPDRVGGEFADQKQCGVDEVVVEGGVPVLSREQGCLDERPDVTDASLQTGELRPVNILLAAPARLRVSPPFAAPGISGNRSTTGGMRDHPTTLGHGARCGKRPSRTFSAWHSGHHARREEAVQLLWRIPPKSLPSFGVK
ncbi:hypothetical protein GCM10027294_16600 [Marinactinospora endophytica]